MATPGPEKISQSPATASSISLFTEIVSIPIDKSIVRTLPEIGHLAPIILSLGSLFFAAATFNYPLAMLGLSSLEAAAIFKLVQTVATYTITPSMLESKEKPSTCTSYFQTVTPSRFNFLLSKGIKEGFPNYPLYFISFASAYCIESMLFYSKECSSLGPQYSNRVYLALASAAMFIILYTLYLLVYGCDSVFTLLFTIVLGSIVGYFICYQNATFFGKTSVNLLFIPTIVDRNGLDYVCVSTR